MIRVTRAPEPAHFDELVRQPGLDAMAELVGEQPRHRKPGSARKKLADSREEIPAKDFPPFWRKSLPDMLKNYQRICAYLSLYIEHATGAPTIDHVLPKVLRWDLVYEWSNYRLACALVNARKGSVEHSLDPFDIGDGLFALELVDFQITLGPGASVHIANHARQTIDELGLNLPECCLARGEYVVNYESGEIDLEYLTRRAPFIALEMRRQGHLLPEDS